MTSSETKERLNCFNNPNWMESALKRCVHLNALSAHYSCFRCCNANICKVLKAEMVKQNKEQLEQVLGAQTITINAKDFQHVYATSSRDNTQYLNTYMGRNSRSSEWLRFLDALHNEDQKGDRLIK